MYISVIIGLLCRDVRTTDLHIQIRGGDADASADGKRICKHFADEVADAIFDDFANADADFT